MYIGKMNNDSPYRVFKAAQPITGGAFTAVAFDGDGLVQAGPAKNPIGILAVETSAEIAAGEEVNVQVSGGSIWLAGAQINAGDLLSADSEGKACPAGEGSYVLAVAFAAAQAGEAVPVLITHAGK